ncbi:MAG: hypothetical protein KF878_30315, partial [Planctomycetes bacterium]|nr:hypothetical protein [Planctomycetota bacterium]
MRPRVPVFHPGSRTPALPEREGVALVGPPGGLFFERGPQWLHGVLVVDAEPDPSGRERWARSLFVTSIWAEASVPNVSNLLGDHHLLGQPARDEGGRWVVPFQLDLSEHLGVDRRPGLHHVQVCARTLRSPVLALTCRPGAPDDAARALFGDAPPQGPVDALLVGSALLRQGRPRAALPHFEAALADDALRGDLDRGVLYQAACAAARAAAEVTEEDAHQTLVERALEWLEEDLARRRRALQERLLLDFYADVAGALPAARSEAFERLRRALVTHFRLARDEDPDLRVLRERAVDDLFHLLPEPVAAPTPEAVAAVLT